MLLVVFLLIFMALLFIFLALSSIPERGWIKRERRIEERLTGLREEEPTPSILRDELLSEIPTLDQFLDGIHAAHSLNFMLNRANIRMRVGEFFLLSILLMVLGFYVCTRSNIPGPAAIIGGLVFGLAPLVFVMAKINRRKERFLEQFPDALDLMSSGLRSGYTLPGSFKILAEEMEDPIGPEFQRAVEQMDLGLDTFEVLEKMMTKVDVPDLNLFVTAVRIQRDTGGNLTEILDKISATIREKQKVKGHLRAITAQGRFTGIVLTFLPVVIVLVMLIINRDYLMVLFRTPLGIRLIQFSVISLLIGFIVVRRIVTFRGF
jgi:tight adherence protein B